MVTVSSFKPGDQIILHYRGDCCFLLTLASSFFQGLVCLINTSFLSTDVPYRSALHFEKLCENLFQSWLIKMFMTFLVLEWPCCNFNLGPSKRLQCANQVAKSEWQHFLTSFWIRFVHMISFDFTWFHMISFDFIWFHTSFHGTTCVFFSKLRITSKPCPWHYLWNASLVKTWDQQCRVASWCPVDRCPMKDANG